ncbi:hypothetical protein CerSpe_166290 [Prunus speciosa]
MGNGQWNKCAWWSHLCWEEGRSRLSRAAVWVASENHLRNNMFNVQGCPIMYFTPLGDNLLMYDGDRTEDTINFLQNNRYKISKPDSVKDEI